MKVKVQYQKNKGSKSEQKKLHTVCDITHILQVSTGVPFALNMEKKFLSLEIFYTTAGSDFYEVCVRSLSYMCARTAHARTFCVAIIIVITIVIVITMVIVIVITMVIVFAIVVIGIIVANINFHGLHRAHWSQQGSA